MNNHWYGKPILAFFIFAAVAVLCLFISSGIYFGESTNSRYTIYSIRFQYYGMDAVEMERLITIPLEEKIAILPQIHEIRSVCEYGKSITTIYFDRTVNAKTAYLSLRDAVDTLYYTLPSAVQRPRIYSSDSNQKAVLGIAVVHSGDLTAVRKYIDTELKKKFEAIDGVAEVITAGGSIDEIRVAFDPLKTVQSGMQPSALGSVIQEANILLPGGILQGKVNDLSFVFDTKIQSIEEIKKIPLKVGEGITSMEYLANISIEPREKEEIVRINGQEGISIQIKSSFLGNSIKISEECKKVLEESEFSDDMYTILYDSGANLYSMIQDVLFAVLQSFICVVILIPFFYRSLRTVILLLLLLPVNTLWTFAGLQLAGFTVNQNTLAGISISLGLIIDASLVIAGLAERRQSFDVFRKSVERVRGAIIASAATTLLVLIPLYFMEVIVPGIRMIVITIALMIGNSVLLSYVFLPCFIYGEHKKGILPQRLFLKVKRFYNRLTYRLTQFSIRCKKITIAVYILLCIVPFVIFVLSGKNISLEEKDEVIFASIEYESDKRADVIDRDIMGVVENIGNERGVTFVHTEVRKGTAELEIGFDEEVIDRITLVERVVLYEKMLSEGFLYVPERGQEKGKQFQEITIAVSGDESILCKAIAEESSAIMGRMPSVNQVVLNFKQPEKNWVFYPDADKLVKNGLSVESVASALRWILFGPVVDKRLQDGDETDIRVVGKDMKAVDLETVKNIYISTEAGGVKLDTLGTFHLEDGSGKIYRKDGRRAAYFTVGMNTGSSDEAIKIINNTMAALPQEKGYGYFLPRELALLQEQYSLLFVSFIASVVGILILLTGLTEQFEKALRITSIIPVSISVPLLVIAISGQSLEMGHILGMVLVSGISVNNVIYIEESQKKSIIFRVREKTQSILVTSCTTIASSVPLVFAGKGNFSGNLAFFMLWGVVGSMIGSLVLYPGLLSWRENKTIKK